MKAGVIVGPNWLGSSIPIRMQFELQAQSTRKKETSSSWSLELLESYAYAV